MTRKDSVLTVKQSRSLLASVTKIANDLVDVAASPAPEEGAGSAGPQEVVDALEIVIDEIAEISEAIPAEPQGATPEEAPVEAPVEEAPVEAPVAEESEEEEPRLAKQVRELQAQLDSQNREKLATQFAELHEGTAVQQAKYDEVLNSKDSLATWTAKIDSIEAFKTTTEGASSSYKPAKNMTSWIKPNSKFAKQNSSEMMSL